MWLKQSAGVRLISTIKGKATTLDYQPVRIALSLCLSLLLRIFLFFLLCPYVFFFLRALFSGFSSNSCLVADGLSVLDPRFPDNGNGVGLRLTFLISCVVILSRKGEKRWWLISGLLRETDNHQSGCSQPNILACSRRPGVFVLHCLILPIVGCISTLHSCKGLLWWTDLDRWLKKALFLPGFHLWRGFSFYEALSYRLRAASCQCPRWHCQTAQTFDWLVFWLQIGEKVILIGALWTRHP